MRSAFVAAWIAFGCAAVLVRAPVTARAAPPSASGIGSAAPAAVAHTTTTAQATAPTASSASSASLASAASQGAPAVGALGHVAAEIARALGAVPSGTLVVASPIATDVPAAVSAKTDELGLRVASVVAGRLGATARAQGQTVQLATARALAAKSGGLVYVALEIVHGELRATADLYPVMSNGWDRIRVPVPPVRAHAFASAPVDAEVHAFLPAIPLEQAAVHRAKHDEGEVLAVACGDVDGDGGAEIVLVSRARVAIAHLQQGKVVVTRTMPWSSIAPRAPVPLREPLAGVTIQPRARGGGVYVGTTDRGGVALDESLGLRGPLRGIPVPCGACGASNADACATVALGEGMFDGDPTTCALVSRDRVSRAASPLPKYDAIAFDATTSASGVVRDVVAVRDPSGKLRVRFGDDVRSLDGVGAQIAVGDLDLDGSPELVVSADSGDDAIFTYTLVPGAEPKLRRKLPAPAGVRALAVCPPEERAQPGLVAIVGNEVWLVR